jgi:hypothetical protein
MLIAAQGKSDQILQCKNFLQSLNTFKWTLKLQEEDMVTAGDRLLTEESELCEKTQVSWGQLGSQALGFGHTGWLPWRGLGKKQRDRPPPSWRSLSYFHTSGSSMTKVSFEERFLWPSPSPPYLKKEFWKYLWMLKTESQCQLFSPWLCYSPDSLMVFLEWNHIEI